jgi:MYXO-CTERM domain-containing protein
VCVAIGVAQDARALPWQPSPGADMKNSANWPNDPGYPTQWSLWSWLPSQAGGAPPYLSADTALGASGIHADAAWTHTTGTSGVLIAIVDSGVDWGDEDLLHPAWLNMGELSGSNRPEGPGGAPCGGTGKLAGYDCNGDGVFDVSDYLQDPRLSAPVSAPSCPGGMSVSGDHNLNCVLDAGDIIEQFSDTVDDDLNGYIDDISGWDFFRNDNDPYDDTGSGHGTTAAHASNAEADNGIGVVGACPGCRFVMLRAADARVGEANDFAKAVAYAADSGASVVQVGLETVDQTPFARSAIDYAYAKGVLVVASLGEENSREHTTPVTANHTLGIYALAPDGAVTASGPAVTTGASSFLGFSTCSNFGGNSALGVGAVGCAGEATGVAAGAAGLLYSEGLDKGLMPPLGAGEVLQLLIGSAELVNVPESRSPDPNVASQYYESLPSFSQRFGYGRANVATAISAIDAGLLPPEVDITSPEWFAVLYASRVSAPVPILGKIAASRAQSYDYRVEWAPGVEPDDSAFQPLVDWVRNVPGATPTGGSVSSPIGLLPPPGQLMTAHAADPDSPAHENDRTITLRVLAVAHYPGGDVPGQARRSVAIVNDSNGGDPDLLPGFPFSMGASMEASPKLADIDGDGVRDIVAATSDGRLHALSMASGKLHEVSGFPATSAPIDGFDPMPETALSLPSYLRAPAYATIDPGLAREAFVSAPAVGDLDGDGKPEIVVTSWPGTVYVFGSDGLPVPGWPYRLPLVSLCVKAGMLPCYDEDHWLARGAGASPVLADFDGDGKPEIVQAAFDGQLYVWHGDGTLLSGFPVPIHSPAASRYDRLYATPAVADFNGDGVPDIVCGSNETVGANEGPVFIVDGRGANAPSLYLSHWPVLSPSLPLMPVVATGMSVSPVVASFTSAGQPQALVQGNGVLPFILPADPGEQVGLAMPPNALPVYEREGGASQGFDPGSEFGALSAAAVPDVMTPLFGQPAVGDLDGDGVLDVAVAGGSEVLTTELTSGVSMTRPPGPAQHLLAMWSGATGHPMPGAPVPIEDHAIGMNAAVADLTGDGYPEVVLGTGGYFVRAVDACGCEASNWPKFTGGWIEATPAVGDIDGDPSHALEVVTGTREGLLYAWHTGGTDKGVVAWESVHHDLANTGNYGTPLTQGVLEGATTPIDCATDCPAPPPAMAPPQVSPGGCGCRVEGRNVPTPAVPVLGVLAALVFRRRRR